jgi:hypothetical protein
MLMKNPDATHHRLLLTHMSRSPNKPLNHPAESSQCRKVLANLKGELHLDESVYVMLPHPVLLY